LYFLDQRHGRQRHRQALLGCYNAQADKPLKSLHISKQTIVFCSRGITFLEPFSQPDQRLIHPAFGRRQRREHQFVGFVTGGFYFHHEVYRLNIDKSEVEGIDPVALTPRQG